MSRVITFSRFFPAYHYNAGKPTFFAEKLMATFADLTKGKIPDAFTDWDWHEYYNARPKLHTIRSGKRWKEGDKFSPRVWTGKPYASKQAEIWSEDIEIKKIFHFETDGYKLYINGKQIESPATWCRLALNDGLSVFDMGEWFNKPFEGQIICWSDKIYYNE